MIINSESPATSLVLNFIGALKSEDFHTCEIIKNELKERKLDNSSIDELIKVCNDNKEMINPADLGNVEDLLLSLKE